MRTLLPTRLSVSAAILAALFVCNAALAQVSLTISLTGEPRQTNRNARRDRGSTGHDTLPNKKSPAFRRDFPALADVSSGLALGLLTRVGLLALTARILLLLTGLLSAALLLAGLLTRVLILLARVLVLFRHRGLRC